MTRIEIFEKEKEYIIHDIFNHHCTILDGRKDSFRCISVQYDQILLSPTEINKIISRYGDRYTIRSYANKQFIINIDLIDKLKDAEPERHVILRPFDIILVRNSEYGEWSPDLLDRMYDKPTSTDSICRTIPGDDWAQVIPYNEDTAHLTNTSDPCPIDYEIEFRKH